MDHRNGTTATVTTKKAPRSQDLTVKIFADGAELEGIRELYANPLIRGFTTNPTLMHKVGIKHYEHFAKDVISLVPDRPISFEVFSGDFAEMERHARRIASWGEHVYVKIPVTNCAGEPSREVLARLADDGVKVNCTGLMTLDQVRWVAEAMGTQTAGCVSVFAGRIADTGVDPIPVMESALEVLGDHPNLELIWASPREILNVVQADQIGCHIITVTHDLLKKLPLLGRDLEEFSLETVRMFQRDAVAAGFAL